MIINTNLLVSPRWGNIWWGWLCLALFIGCFCGAASTSKNYLLCGIVKGHSDKLVKIVSDDRGRTETVLYLLVKFDNGTFEAMKSTPTDYFKYRDNDKVCYKKQVPMSLIGDDNNVQGWLLLLSAVFGFIIFTRFITCL